MYYKPVIVLVGRPNVGKSTLFNRFTKSKDALVANFSGLTRDRIYGDGTFGNHEFIIIDTGGFEPSSKDQMYVKVANQTNQAILEADIVIFLVDGKDGLCSTDYDIANFLRKLSITNILLVVNKSEGKNISAMASEFHELGFGSPFLISASHGDGVGLLIESIFESKLNFIDYKNDDVLQNDNLDRKIRLSIVGQPNVGKSTLINSMLGEERLITFDSPGTTRDSINVDFGFLDRSYVLIDTAGLRRRSRVSDYIEKFSVVKTLQSIEKSNVVLLLLDANIGISDQDARIASYILESGKAIVIAINKWDSISVDSRSTVEKEFKRKLHFLSFANMHFISALRKTNIKRLLFSVNDAYDAAFAKLPTPKVTRALLNAIKQQPPPKKGIFVPKLRYAHQGGHNPPVIVIHGNCLTNIQDSYIRYLESCFRREFKLSGTPLRIEFKSSKNPYV
ncbi:ribosome biogenesis GTPase Der [Candidatus Kinetoplastidibacterium galati]|uniref:GTPase Der n=1 Tax=Candidatus Kinetoplastidibacterium galati TCC219 TaxID=1208921 RepID=M1L953_9PROT|nr:ribosome biogenesis GTPase Der [Candidatus Kinetoplastibacterium galatii]AGF49093.1 GTP-binding protein [Candidatus Kinetoplastibacterium galatii TCC219]